MDGVLARLYAATFLYAFVMSLGIPLVPELLELKYAASLAFVGFVMGVYGVMQIFLRLPMGDMADRKGRRLSLKLAFACVFVSGLFFVFEQSPAWAIPGVAFFGFAGGIFWVAANSYLFDRVATLSESDGAESNGGLARVTARRVSAGDPESLRVAPPPADQLGPGGGVHSAPHARPVDAAEGNGTDMARATSDYTLMLSGAFLAGPLVGHWLADAFSFSVAFSTFLWASVLGFALVLTLPELPRKPRPKPKGSPYARAWRLLKHPALKLSAIGTFLYSVLFATMNSFFQLHALAVGLGLVTIGYLLAWRQASALLVRLGLPRVLRRVGAVRVLFAGVVMAAVATTAVPFATELWGLVVVVTLFGAATGVMIPANLMLVHEGAPEGERGLANGIYGTMLGVGSAFAPLAFGGLGTLLDRAWSFWAAGAVALLGVLALAVLARELTRSAGKASAA